MSASLNIATFKQHIRKLHELPILKYHELVSFIKSDLCDDPLITTLKYRIRKYDEAASVNVTNLHP